MTHLQVGETWYKSGPYGHGILEEHYDLTAKTDHSRGPTFGEIHLTHMSEEARRMASCRASIAAAAPELLEACKAARDWFDRNAKEGHTPGPVEKMLIDAIAKTEAA